MKVNCDNEGVRTAFRIVSQGGIIVYPTDTVYGIGCNPYNTDAVNKIYKIKLRDASKPVPVLAYSLETAEKIVQFDEVSRKMAEHFWPGPLTMILKVTDEKIKKSLSLENKIAIRVPNHQCTLKLLKKCDFLVGTSANISGNSSCTNPEDCIKNLHDYDVIVDGGTIQSQGESTIIEAKNKEIKIIREGSLTKEEILQI